MEKKRKKTGFRTDFVDTLSVPPGFISKTSFALKKVPAEETCIGMSSLNASKETLNQIDLISCMNDVAILSRSSQYQQCNDKNNHNQEVANLKPIDKDLPSETCLPKGVVLGCPPCSNCLKVTARWRPEDAKKDVLEDAPVFKPTEEEFNDTLKYIATIYPKAEAYGVCRIIPPSSWNQSCLIKEKSIWETSRFATQIQRVDGLQCHYSQSKRAKAAETMNSEVSSSFKIGSACRTANGFSGEGKHDVVGSGPDPEFTLKTFKELADEFKEQYFCLTNNLGPDENQNDHRRLREPTVDDIESEYRRIIENPTEEIEVLYGDNLDIRSFGSGFLVKSELLHKSIHHEYVDLGWNLKNAPKLPSSLLSFETYKNSSALFPRLQIGMCFSSCFWKVEDHHLYSLCYMHLGAPKIWYVIPGRYNVMFESIMRKYLPDSLKKQPELHNTLVRQLSPYNLKSQGIPVSRCVQYPGEFVLLFPATYYSGFSCGFNCAEAVNFAPLDWLPHGQNIVEIYSEQKRKTSISQDKLLLGAAVEAVKEQLEILLLRKNTKDNMRWKDACGKDGILTKAFKSRVQLEANRRKYLCSHSRSERMDKNFDSTCKRECCLCYYDLHLSAARCQCSMNRYSCLIHSKQLCSCAWSEKIFLFRYDIDELNLLVEALEGKLSAVYKWAKKDLRSAIHSSILGNQMQLSRGTVDKVSRTHELATEKHKSHSNTTPDGPRTGAASSFKESRKAKILQSRSVNKHKQTQKTGSSTSERPLDISSASGSE